MFSLLFFHKNNNKLDSIAKHIAAILASNLNPIAAVISEILNPIKVFSNNLC